MTKNFSLLSFAVAAFLALGLASSVQAGKAKAQKLTAYKDKVRATITGSEPITDGVRLTFEAAGTASKLGKMTTLGFLDVNTTDLSFTGENTLTSSKGDTIFLTIVGQLTPTADPAVFIIRLRTEFLSGTARFDGVRGGFFGEGLLNATTDFVGSTFAGKGFGAITTPLKIQKLRRKRGRSMCFRPQTIRRTAPHFGEVRRVEPQRADNRCPLFGFDGYEF